MEFKRTHTAANRGTSTYASAEGLTIYLPKSVGVHPESIVVEGLTAPTKPEPKPKLSKEERKAAREAMTPEQRIAAAQEQARKAKERADKLAAKLAAAQ